MGISLETDFLIVGAGIAGLRAAITLAEAGRVLVITKEALDESNTHYAQGGIAVAMGGDEDISLHLEDTIQAGDGLVDEAAAAILVEEGPLRVEELLLWGTGFDRHNGELMLTREGAHSRSRILHAHGDATGAEIGRALLAHAKTLRNVTLLEWTTCVDLIVQDSDDGSDSGEQAREVTGLIVLNSGGELQQIRARAVLLASGGAGQVYSDTTNPAVATGDGIAAAFRAGAEISDMEFYQFHPTALSLPGVPRFLLSEALRGEGAYLRNARGERFMQRYHPLLELAPRDVVARAITREGMPPSAELTSVPTSSDEASGAGYSTPDYAALNGSTQSAANGSKSPVASLALPDGSLPVYLDMRHVKGIDLAQRFPGITAFLRLHNLDLSRDLIPVRPAAHYLMGGVRTGVDARASIRRLYAAGEAACTGVHGANRLASNSLLEGLVFGARAALSMREEPPLSPAAPQDGETLSGLPPVNTSLDPSLQPALRKLMWRKAGLLRDAANLRAARAELEEIAGQIPPIQAVKLHRAHLELANLHAIASLIVGSALAREESRGAHFRNDYPVRNDQTFRRHSVVVNGEVLFPDAATNAGEPHSSIVVTTDVATTTA
ncbi:MAG TPA: L-aspartate oxidase [Acidisarcina sp.]